jgi:hypothetical protein
MTQAFYNSYLSCLNNRFNNHTTNSTQKDCSYDSYSILTPQLITHLNQAKDFDPILCAQNIPRNIYTRINNSNDTNVKINVYEYFGSYVSHSVDLIKTKNQDWKITNITCK